MINVYVRRAGGTRQGKLHPAPPFGYVAAARFLSAHNKFREEVQRTGEAANRPTSCGTVSRQ